MKRIFLIMITIVSIVQGMIRDRDANDVYAVAEILEKKIIHLAGEKNIEAKYMKLPNQFHKSPRQVLQKSIEVLQKINKYRENSNLGRVSVPIYSSDKVLDEDVYYSLIRLNTEVDLLLKKIHCKHIKMLSKKKTYIDKTSNETYHMIWLASLAMDELLGKGFSPTDNYKESMLIIDIIKFMRNSQGIYENIVIPQKKIRKHPNHVLYATNKLLSKISKAEKRLWMEPVDVPQNPQRIITPTEVYDSMQMVVTELKRIRRRLGIERFYKTKDIKSSKTPSDVLQNIEYAIELFPKFDVSKELIQYNRNSLKRTINDIYSLSEFIVKKVQYLKEVKGVKVNSKAPPMIYGLNKMHIYQKAIETMEKINKLRVKDKLYEVAIPLSPTKEKSTDAVNELLLMIDDELSIIMERNGIENVQRWSYVFDRKKYTDKTPSDIYHNLWKISSIIDVFRGVQYSPNETYILATKLEQRIDNIVKYLIVNVKKIDLKQSNAKRASDVFTLSLKLYETLVTIEKRANISIGSVEIPKEKSITPDTVYNALRVINATLIELSIHFGIDSSVEEEIVISSKKTPSDVYDVVYKSYETLKTLLKDSSYED